MEKKKIHYGWYIVIGCLLITCTMVPPIMALSNKFLIQVTEELGLSRSGFTLANTILQGLGIFISPMVSSRLAKGDMRKIQCISIIGFALSYASYSLAQNAIHLYISSVFIGVFWLNSALIPVSMMITNWFAKKRGLAMSIAMAGIGVGGTIFSPIVTMLLEKYGWRHTYQIMALIVLVIALPAAFFILRKRPEDMGLKPYGSDEADTKTADKSSDKKESDLSLEVQQCWPKFFFWLMLIGMLCNGLINSGSLGLEVIEKEEIHLAIVDVMMPRMDGIQMTVKLREKYDFPVIFLSAKSEEVDKIMGLNMGADDYVTKPFTPLELLARVNSQLRRYRRFMEKLGDKEKMQNIHVIGGLELDEERVEVRVDGELVKVTPMEYKILLLLMKNPGRVFSADEIYERVWNERAVNTDTMTWCMCEIFVRKLRLTRRNQNI